MTAPGFALAALLASIDAAAQSSPLSIAVLDIQAQVGVEPAQAEVFGVLLQDELRNALGYKVIGRGDIEAMLGLEKMKDMLACQDNSSCMAQIGGALGVDEILTGSLAKLGSYTIVSLKRIDPVRAVVQGSTTRKLKGAGEDDLIEAVGPMVAELYSGAPRRQETPPAASRDAERPTQQRRPTETERARPDAQPAPGAQQEATHAGAAAPVGAGPATVAAPEPESEPTRLFRFGVAAGGVVDGTRPSDGVAADLELAARIGRYAELGAAFGNPTAFSAIGRVWLLDRHPVHLGVNVRWSRFALVRTATRGSGSSMGAGATLAVGRRIGNIEMGGRLEIIANKNFESRTWTVPILLSAYGVY